MPSRADPGIVRSICRKAPQDRLNAQYGLDQPLYVQYITWAGAFIQGDFGPSYRFQDRRVNDIIADGIWTTVQLGVMAFILSVGVGIPLGIFAALGHNRARTTSPPASRSSASPRPFS